MAVSLPPLDRTEKLLPWRCQPEVHVVSSLIFVATLCNMVPMYSHANAVNSKSERIKTK